MNDAGEIVGMVDVLKLTYATLEQVNAMSTGDNEGPAWNKFWLSLDNETESMVSGEGSHQHTHPTRSLMSPDITRERITDSVAPGDSASHVGQDSPQHSAVAPSPELPPSEIPCAFKFKAPSGRVHRVQVIAAQGVAQFVSNVASKLGSETEGIGGLPEVEEGKILRGFALSYMDDEGDSVSITTDQDLLEAIILARQLGRDKVDLFVHDPDKPPIQVAAIPDLVALPTPPASSASGLRERRRHLDSDEEDEDEDEDTSPVRRARKHKGSQQQAEIIAGVPNELLLPGAIVTLAVVIVGVFAIGRASSR